MASSLPQPLRQRWFSPGLVLDGLAYEAVLWRDFPLLQLTVLTWAALIILINFLVDLVYVVLDPRIRL